MKINGKIMRRLRSSFFLRLLMLFCAVMIITMVTFSISISGIVTDSLEERQAFANSIIQDNVLEYFNSKYSYAYKVFENIYTDSALKRMIFDLVETTDRNYYATRLFEKRDLIVKLNTLFQYDDDMANLMIYKQNTDQLYMYSRKYGTFSELTNEDEIKRTLATVETGMRNSCVYEIADLRNHTDRLYGISFNLYQYRSTDTPATAMISFSIDSIQSITKRQIYRLNGNILITNQSDDIIFDSSGEYYFQEYPYMEQLRSGERIVMLGNEENIVSHSYVAGSRLDFFAFTPVTQIRQIAQTVRILIYTVCFVLLTIGIVLFSIVFRFYYKAVNSVINVMDKVHDGDLTARITVSDNNDEIAKISGSFNRMCDKLLEQMSYRMIAQERQKSAELLSLQSKIDPHFIYNTLEAIHMYSIQNDHSDTPELIRIFAELFRDSVREGTFTDIADEINACKIYTDLFLIRYGYALKIEYRIDNEVSGYGIPRKTLQPILENFFVHGYDNRKEENAISIDAFMEGSDILIRVIDNGVGITEEKLESIRNDLRSIRMDSKERVGISNVNDRLKIIYGKGYGISIESVVHEYTNVTIRIRALTKQQLESNFLILHAEDEPH